ncbi:MULTISPECIES: RNA-binding S4 domain-containing protein [Microbispora]|uniref:RNA-binding S4 domain-containing protein n=5 Tax=Microbispora TaxID=2005 RepID=A0ABY3LSM5_9ACTN|nr:MULTISPECIES: RNA-binding S4 domain-containing protein [Microbispora]KAA9380594.1 RNA-binding S4 domain-containing protein [Microbispora cellulosiformans]MBO4274331.1 RNA-binding S4 domain-containing protein [Microbispora triticiradicis]RGA01427.1 RNA-binding S4 domain-containing protein [Microbispora triticiradicis]TLP63799.1 RNA-binding S4 domain-containing protein [Microbispora fusca]TYB51754.1 RNA-binding S4 domain-containing protein [Microbispora tritici]
MNEAITFELDGDHIPLCDLLKFCQIADSGGAAKHLVAEGLVRVDGQVELRKACKIRAGQVVTGDDYTIRVV